MPTTMTIRQRKTIRQGRTLLLIACAAFGSATGANFCHPSLADEIKKLEMSYEKKDTAVRRPQADWQETMLLSRQKIRKLRVNRKQRDEMQKQIWRQIEKDFPVQWDWVSQDYGMDFHKWFSVSPLRDALRRSPKDNNDATFEFEKKIIGNVLTELGAEGGQLAADFELLCRSSAGSPRDKASPNDRRWLDLYVKACEKRRSIRLRPLLEKCNKIVFTKHYNMGGSHYAYTEGQSDAQHERTFVPGSALCLKIDRRTGRHDEQGGAILIYGGIA